MAATANEGLRDAAIDHQVDLIHYGNGVLRRMLALLNRADADLFAQIMVALDRLPRSSFTVERLDALLASVRQINAAAYDALGRDLPGNLRDLTQTEAQFQLELFQSVAVQLQVAAVAVEQVYAAAMAQPFQGRLLREWASGLEADRMARIRDAIRIGVVQNQSIAEIVRRLRGSRAAGYADGLLEIDRRNAEAVVTTAVQHTAAFTRNRFYQANADLIKALVWHATLDSRTSEGCRIRDGKQYTLAHRPIGHTIPWAGGPGQLHWRCRSTAIPVLKSWRELGMDADELPDSTRASMDGQVAAETTYGQWLHRQSAARQDEILGPTRGALLRRGGLELDRFANDKGRWLTIEQLRERNAAAFKRAGLEA